MDLNLYLVHELYLHHTITDLWNHPDFLLFNYSCVTRAFFRLRIILSNADKINLSTFPLSWYSLPQPDFLSCFTKGERFEPPVLLVFLFPARYVYPTLYEECSQSIFGAGLSPVIRKQWAADSFIDQWSLARRLLVMATGIRNQDPRCWYEP